MEELRLLLDFSSFWTIWFWIAHVVTWSLASHYTLSVPFDMIIRANRAEDESGDWARHCEATILAALFRIVTMFNRFGTIIVAIWFFLLSVLATFAFWFDQEFSAALFTILGPLTLLYGISVWRAFKLDAAGLRGQELRDAVRRQRLINQGIGLLGIIFASVMAIFEILKTISPFWM